VLPFIIGDIKSSKPRRGDIFGDINSHKNLASLIPGVMLDILQLVSSGGLPIWSSSIWGEAVWVFDGGFRATWNVWHWSFIIPRIMLDILQQVSSGYLSSWSTSILATLTRCGMSDHKFLARETIPDDVMPLEIDYLTS